jgi:polyisoprenoid-binding protein YceI
MRVFVLTTALALAACAGASGAGDQPPPFTSAAPQNAPVAATYPTAVDVPAGDYQLDQRHASVIFRIRHEGLAWFTARFDTKEASLTLDPADPTRSRLRASIDATSVNTGVLNAQGERAFDRSVARALGADASAAITFVSTSIERTGEHTGRIIGDLTMNGQTHPMTLDATFDGSAVDPLRRGATVLGFSAHGSINRSDWGVTEWRAFTGDEVQIVIEAELART